MLARLAVPSSEDTIFLNIGKTLSETSLLIILSLFNFWFSLINFGCISNPPFERIEYALTIWSKVVVMPWPKDAVANGHLPHLKFIGLPTSSISKLISLLIPSLIRKDLNFSS